METVKLSQKAMDIESEHRDMPKQHGIATAETTKHREAAIPGHRYKMGNTGHWENMGHRL